MVLPRDLRALGPSRAGSVRGQLQVMLEHRDWHPVWKWGCSTSEHCSRLHGVQQGQPTQRHRHRRRHRHTNGRDGDGSLGCSMLPRPVLFFCPMCRRQKIDPAEGSCVLCMQANPTPTQSRQTGMMFARATVAFSNAGPLSSPPSFFSFHLQPASSSNLQSSSRPISTRRRRDLVCTTRSVAADVGLYDHRRLLVRHCPTHPQCPEWAWPRRRRQRQDQTQQTGLVRRTALSVICKS